MQSCIPGDHLSFWKEGDKSQKRSSQKKWPGERIQESVSKRRLLRRWQRGSKRGKATGYSDSQIMMTLEVAVLVEEGQKPYSRRLGNKGVVMKLRH